ncbi:MAG: hypothetical protein A3F54_04095 [Candidatus Kerfeldbacteria bacterium RIFCSPHIGHO2_12_FULL_48_17]|uniref:Uncharacterized protein n=1 Tax=Candidatus Kerfeldbacteria bacterium RIFCSPHIGHO2_12_FULL_48_17 TaxID=1798542 RepID=A0A1G2AZ22_9BACT|nr:MAG: hypothetical protein A3F54_04095 [Candidatus Kerfeldbacteria bacterium RIFCSPHIGHO2_12_FULL_48_17]
MSSKAWIFSGSINDVEYVESALGFFRRNRRMRANDPVYIFVYSADEWEIARGTSVIASRKRVYVVREYTGDSVTREWQRIKDNLVQVYGDHKRLR